MKYNIGDKVQLKSGKIVTITHIEGTLKTREVYFWGNKQYIQIDEEIIGKVED